MSTRCYAATPHKDLINELMNPNNPKNEREHDAVREIEWLREVLAQHYDLYPDESKQGFGT